MVISYHKFTNSEILKYSIEKTCIRGDVLCTACIKQTSSVCKPTGGVIIYLWNNSWFKQHNKYKLYLKRDIIISIICYYSD